ncbi:hypothetical protein EV561_1499 [Rhizobium sp. BK376]|nr:hypothetical protein EV561_1499 [Rhizobium sp. BK376]
MTEWFLAGHTTMWGMVLVMNKDLFDQAAWTGFRALFGESEGWG